MGSRNLALGLLVLTALATSGAAQCELGPLIASDAADGDAFGAALSIDGDLALVGAPHKDGTGAAYIFERTSLGWLQVAKLTASDGASGDLFGASVAIFGDTAIVGAPGKSDVASGAGAAYAFERPGNAWYQTAKLASPSPRAFAEFGRSVAVWFDFALVGEPGGDGATSAAGVVHSFFGSGGAWTPIQAIADANGEPGDRFGASVALRGSTAAIGAPLDDGAGRHAGCVHVFQQGAVMFFPSAELFADDASAFAGLGASVALDGTALLAGAPWAPGAGGTNAGAAYVFGSSGSGWGQVDKLVAAEGLAIDGGGAAVALLGGRALVGAPQNLGALAGPGRAYVFQVAGAGWVQTASVVAGDGEVFDNLGGAVGLHAEELLVGAAYDDVGGTASGSVRLFGPAGAPAVYCTAKTTSSGCLPSISASGSPGVSSGGAFVIRAGAVEPGNVGVFFYGKSGAAAVPFQGGFLCVQPPVLRTAGQGSGGTTPCTGAYQIDFDAYVQSGVDPTLVAGTSVHGQFWFRDPPDPISGTGLSDAIGFVLCR